MFHWVLCIRRCITTVTELPSKETLRCCKSFYLNIFTLLFLWYFSSLFHMFHPRYLFRELLKWPRGLMYIPKITPIDKSTVIDKWGMKLAIKKYEITLKILLYVFICAPFSTRDVVLLYDVFSFEVCMLYVHYCAVWL